MPQIFSTRLQIKGGSNKNEVYPIRWAHRLQQPSGHETTSPFYEPSLLSNKLIESTVEQNTVSLWTDTLTVPPLEDTSLVLTKASSNTAHSGRKSSASAGSSPSSPLYSSAPVSGLRTTTSPHVTSGQYSSRTTSPEQLSLQRPLPSETQAPSSSPSASSKIGTVTILSSNSTGNSSMNAGTLRRAHNEHDSAKIVLACVLGGVLGLVGCAIIGYCMFNLKGWYRDYKKRKLEKKLSPSLSPLHKIESDDPLAYLDDSIEVRHGSPIFVSSPLDAGDILGIQARPPIVPPMNPRRQPISHRPLSGRHMHNVSQTGQPLYQFRPRPEIRTPRSAPSPPGRLAGAVTRGINTEDGGILSLNDLLSDEHSTIKQATMGNPAFENKHLTVEGSSETESSHDGSLVLDPDNRNSSSSSCYSRDDVNEKPPPSKVQVNVDRTSQSSFEALMNLAAPQLVPSLPLVEEDVAPSRVDLQASAETRRQSIQPSTEREATVSSPDVYDDGHGTYSLHEFEIEGRVVTVALNQLQEAERAFSLDDLDLFADQ